MSLETRLKNIHALLEPNRIHILELLLRNDSCVCEMVKELSIKHSLLSHHLQTLAESGFITNKRNGRHNVYRINEDKVFCVKTVLDLLNSPDHRCT